jgi:23S rRNA-/tRNA-specific pseudouridylate synthase
MKKIPRKYQPKGFEILYEDRDVIVGNKAAGLLTVGALWEKENTVHNLLNQYVRKGNPRSRACVFVVHRLDQATTGLLIFAKSEEAQQFLKLKEKKGRIESFLQEDEDYKVHSSQQADQGKLAITEYEVIREVNSMSLVKINLLTGKKNQIRVHMADLGHPVVGDAKYGKSETKFKTLALHSESLDFIHPFSQKRILITAPVPEYFSKLLKAR